MNKILAEDCSMIDVYFLKKHGYLRKDQYKRGGIKWYFGEREIGAVSFDVSTYVNSIRFYYSSKCHWQDEWEQKDYTVNLLTTKCNLGGVRYWFECPSCSKRVGSLYLYGDYDFRCRYCLDLAYRSQNRTRRGGMYKVFEASFALEDVEEVIYNLRTKYYRGKPTRRYQKLLNKRAALNQMIGGVSYEQMASWLL